MIAAGSIMDMTQLLEPLNAVGKLVQHKQRMGSANSRQSLQSTCEIPHHDDVFLEKGSRSPSQIAAISRMLLRHPRLIEQSEPVTIGVRK